MGVRGAGVLFSTGSAWSYKTGTTPAPCSGGGQSVGLGFESAPADGHYHPLQDGGQVLLSRRRQGHEERRAVAVEDEDPVRHEGVEVDVQIEGASNPCSPPRAA